MNERSGVFMDNVGDRRIKNIVLCFTWKLSIFSKWTHTLFASKPFKWRYFHFLCIFTTQPASSQQKNKSYSKHWKMIRKRLRAIQTEKKKQQPDDLSINGTVKARNRGNHNVKQCPSTWHPRPPYTISHFIRKPDEKVNSNCIGFAWLECFVCSDVRRVVFAAMNVQFCVSVARVRQTYMIPTVFSRIRLPWNAMYSVPLLHQRQRCTNQLPIIKFYQSFPIHNHPYKYTRSVHIFFIHIPAIDIYIYIYSLIWINSDQSNTLRLPQWHRMRSLNTHLRHTWISSVHKHLSLRWKRFE